MHCPISIHALREEGDLCLHAGNDSLRISIHALREEGDRTWSGWFPAGSYFYPRPPRGGRRPCKLSPQPGRQFLSTPSARRATKHGGARWCSGSHFYPRPPRGGRRMPVSVACGSLLFLSTPSARRATLSFRSRCNSSFKFLSTPSARRATRCLWNNRR